MQGFPFVPYPPIEKLGLIGDRRTAALVAADGTLCWLCLPNYDGLTVFGALLDAMRGGGWKLGPATRRLGRQRYFPDGPLLQTTWEEVDYLLELVDFMPWPQDRRDRSDDGRRVVIRRLRCHRGAAPCRLALRPRENFAHPMLPRHVSAQTTFAGRQHELRFWCSRSAATTGEVAESYFVLNAGEELWCTLEPDCDHPRWTVAAASAALQATRDYWDRWTSAITFGGSRRTQIQRSAMLVHLLTFAPTGALIASPTMSLPEHIGGDRNYDYRYTWIRDASLGLGLLARLGLVEDARRFLDWLADLLSPNGRPLRVIYTIDGDDKAAVVRHGRVAGYRRSRPVRTGNAAAAMSEIDSYGYLADCFLTYLQHGGVFEDRHWQVVKRIADYTARHWRMPGSSIWELRPQQHFVASKAMSAVTLDRAAQIARQSGIDGDFLSEWQKAGEQALAEIMTRGWSGRLCAFRQHYDTDALDAAALLIPIMNLLPADHPRVTSTLAALRRQLEVNGFLHRFDDSRIGGGASKAIGDHEGAFLMCSFWFAQVLAQRGDIDQADAILTHAESIAGDVGLFAEAVDARSDTFLGNMPLVFSQAEYAKAAIALEAAREKAATRSAVAVPVAQQAPRNRASKSRQPRAGATAPSRHSP